MATSVERDIQLPVKVEADKVLIKIKDFEDRLHFALANLKRKPAFTYSTGVVQSQMQIVQAFQQIKELNQEFADYSYYS